CSALPAARSRWAAPPNPSRPQGPVKSRKGLRYPVAPRSPAQALRPPSTGRPPPQTVKLSFLGSLLTVAIGLALAAALATAALVPEAREQFVDEGLQADGRLRLLDPAAGLEVGVRPARTEADVLAAEQPLRLDAREAVVRDLVVLRIDAHPDHRLVGLGVETD